MERLTKTTEIGNAYFPKCFEEPCCGMGKCIDNNCNLVNEVCKKLAEYETLEEQGLLVRLPCKFGDILYCIDNGIVETLIVNGFGIYNFNRVEIDFENASGFALCTFSGELDEGYFLTREEAEKKLEVMKNE